MIGITFDEIIIARNLILKCKLKNVQNDES